MSSVRREARVFDAARAEVFITYRCSRCGKSKPLAAFGLRKMDDGKIRSIPQCRDCRALPALKPRQRPAHPSPVSGPGPTPGQKRDHSSTGANEGDGHA